MVINLTDADLDHNPTLRKQMLYELEFEDPRMNKKHYDSLVKSYQSYEDYMQMCKLEHKYQLIIRNVYLSNAYGIRVYDLKKLLRQEYPLNNEQVNKIIEHLINNNKYVEVDENNQSNPLLFMLYKSPRQAPINSPYARKAGHRWSA